LNVRNIVARSHTRLWWRCSKTSCVKTVPWLKLQANTIHWKHNGGLLLGFGDRPSRFPFRVWRSRLLPPFSHEEEEEEEEEKQECSSSSLRLGVYFFTLFDWLLVHMFRGVLEVQFSCCWMMMTMMSLVRNRPRCEPWRTVLFLV
jgi:hypothetical protein